ncbi:MAG: bactofilin family protein [Candidatus Limnocylindria bacterium]
MDYARRDLTSAGNANGDLNALLGKGSEFDGKLSFEGTVRIDGTFSGEITTSDTLIVGEGAKVQAEISCGSVVVHGEVNGNIKASTSVELHRPSRVKGDITTPSLSIEKGVAYEGHMRMEGAAPATSNLFHLEREAVGEA